MAAVNRLVAKAVQHGQPALALTDHGLMSGAVQLYQECKKSGIKPFIGIETYLIDPRRDDWESPEKGAPKIGRFHVGLLALNEDGYKALVAFSSKTHTRPRFNRFARCTLSDLAELGQQHGKNVALTTGCYFGWLQQTLVNDGYAQAKQVLQTYRHLFPNTFVEVQHHNIIHDDGVTDSTIVEQLFQMARETGLPAIATQDAHYCDSREKAAHALMKRMSYGGSDDEFPGDSFHLASTEWVREHYTDQQWSIIERGCKRLLDLGDTTIPPLDKFTVDVPKVKGVLNPRKHVQKVCETNLETYIKEQGLGDDLPLYRQRLEHELDVINTLKMASYFCIWEKFVQWCRDENIAVEARGSANGSLVCFLLGVTQVDPIRWGTLFERFLSTDRIKPPDIDMDIEDVERPRAVKYMLSLYSSCQIGTFSRLGTSIDEDGEERGSIMVSWKAYKRKECEQVATKAFERGRLDKKGAIKPYSMAVFNNRYGDVNTLQDVARVSSWEAKGLKQINNMGSVYRSYGVHAGGVLLSGQHIKITDYIPTMLVASSNTLVTQFDMDDVEKFGLLKMDILGQATLQSMKLTMEAIGRDDPADFSWIEDDDRAACKELSNGRTKDGVFHFEGYTKAKGGRELGCKTTMDAVLCQALYMPGCMDVAPGMNISQKDLYLERRKSARARKDITYLHPAFEKALNTTYGAVVFQEQVIQIMRNLGMDIAGINNFFSVVKDSGRGATERNAKRLAAVREQFDRLCEQAGIDSEEAWRQTASFVTYGFNRCITGDTVVTRSSGNQHQSREVTVKDLYDVWHGPHTATRDKYRHQGLHIMARDGDRIRTDKMVGVHYQGKQHVYRVTLANGMSITGTANHRHLSEYGWRRVDRLSIGDMLATMGETEKFVSPIGTGNPVGTHNGEHLLKRQIKNLAACEYCGEDDASLELAHLDGDRSNNTRQNLRLLCNSCHKQHDWDTGQRRVRHSRGNQIRYVPIVAIEDAGIQDTYDVEMEGKDHSWVGNGIVTHNSHATGYGIRSYRTAYTKTHYPLEHMYGLLQTWAGKDKEKEYIAEARRIGIRILPPDVNVSGMSWTIDRDRGAIRKGLLSIKGIGESIAPVIADNAPYTSIEDMIDKLPKRVLSGGDMYLRTGSLSGTLGKLADANALSSILED